MIGRLALVAAAGCSVGIVSAVGARLGADDHDGDKIRVVDFTHDDGVTYRCLVSDAGLWCERIWVQVPPSHDCGPNGDQECGPERLG
jgi:hypothetical protein